MVKENNIIGVSLRAGEAVMEVAAKGNAAQIIAIGAAAALAVAGTAIGYGGYVGCKKLIGYSNNK